MEKICLLSTTKRFWQWFMFSIICLFICREEKLNIHLTINVEDYLLPFNPSDRQTVIVIHEFSSLKLKWCIIISVHNFVKMQLTNVSASTTILKICYVTFLHLKVQNRLYVCDIFSWVVYLHYSKYFQQCPVPERYVDLIVFNVKAHLIWLLVIATSVVEPDDVSEGEHNWT